MVENNFEDIYKTFNISYFSKNDNLVSNFVDPINLKDYESIDESKDNLISILIKKFKLKISFTKNSTFSNKIIISDTYDLDIDKLNHTDSLIKIAIIKDNCQEWLDSANLNDYDYIFSLKKFHEKLKEEYNIFLIEDKSVYEQINFILNELYRKKLDKFYSFLKYIDFKNVFPKWKNYYKVLNSQYFDDQWYRKTYDISDNTDSVVHFLLVGSVKGYDPGPDFNNFEYLECNLDVKGKRINPLIHYELYGKKDHRLINISDLPHRNYSCIADSSYFDGDWYGRTYGVEGDCVDHYLNVGYTKGYNPGPDFSNFEYFECNLDIKEWEMNPLLHYELYGKRENRAINLADEVNQKYYNAIADSSYFDGDWYGRTYGVEGDCVDHYLNVGYALGFNPGPDFSTREYYDCNKDVEDYGMNPLLHYELYGQYESRMIWVSEMKDRDYSCIADSSYFDGDWYGRTYGVEGDCVDHYLNVGYTKGYNPSPKFNAYDYIERNPIVKEWEMNPLLYYELYG